jgi:translocation and assembly module TamB
MDGTQDAMRDANRTASEAKPQRILIGLGIVLGLLVVLLIAARILVMTPLGAGLAERQLDGQSIGGLGVLEVEGLGGDLLSDARLRRLAIVDDEGPWLEIENLHVRWRPGVLIHRIVSLELVEADAVRLNRRPPTGEQSQQARGGGWGFALDAASLPQVELGEAVLGEAAVLAANVKLEADREGDLDIALDVRRTDIAGDVLTLSGTRDRSGRAELAAVLVAPAQGPLATLIRLPSQTIRANASLSGDLSDGEGEIDATLDDAPFLAGSVSWDAEGASMTADVQLPAAPELAEIASRLGPSAQASVTLGEERDGLRPATLMLESEGLSGEAAGAVDIARRTAPEGLAVTLSSPQIDQLIGDAKPEPLRLGAGSVEGRVTFGERTEFDGIIRAADAAWDDWSAAAVSGPARLGYGAGRSSVTTYLSVDGAAAPEAFARAVGPTPRVSVEMVYDYAERRIEASAWSVTVAAGDARGEASLALDGGPITLSAEARIADASMLPGVAGGSGRIIASLERAAAGEPIRVTLDGAGEGLAAQSESIAALLGRAPTVDADVEIAADGGAQITRAVLRGERLQLEAMGGVSRASGYDLDIDAAVQGPLALGPAALGGAATVAARLEGAFASPRLRLDARANSLDAGVVAFESPRLRAEIDDLLKAPTGTIAFDAETDRGPAAVSTEIAYVDGALTARAIHGGWAGYEISGDARGGGGASPSGSFDVGGLGGRLGADVSLATGEGAPVLALHATLRDQPIADAGVLGALTVAVTGPIDALDLSLAARGYAGSEFSLEASGRLTSEAGATRITLSPRGRIGTDSFSAPTPWTATFSDGETSIAAALDAAGGALSTSLVRRNGATTLTAELTDAPLSLVNFIRPEPRLDGRASASISLQGRTTLEGESRLTITGASAPDYAPDEHLDLTLTVTHAADGADVDLTATDGGSFNADVAGRAPVVLAAWPPTPRIDRSAPVSLSGQAQGDIAPIWALAGLTVVALDGQVDARGQLSGTLTAPSFEGRAAVSEGTLEEARIGLALSDLQGTATLVGPRLVVERLTASDGQGGTASASGEVEFGGEEGSETSARLQATRLQVINAGGNLAVASGDLAFSRREGRSELSGDLVIDRADVTPPRGGAGGAVDVPVLEVVEINRPSDLEPPPSARRDALKLALAVSASRRLFIRTNGLDSEWALDLDVMGTTAAPRLEGEATLVRGDLTIAGERFDLERATITFDGRAADAEIDLTATRDAADLTVTAHVTGTAEQPKIELTSSPPYPQDEILARVLYGRSASELTALEAAQLAGALASLAGGGGFDLLGPLRQTLGVDRLAVRGDGAGGALVSGGRYIAEDVYLEVGSTPTGLAQASIEWEIRPRLELVSRLGVGRDSSVTLRWRRDY